MLARELRSFLDNPAFAMNQAELHLNDAYDANKSEFERLRKYFDEVKTVSTEYDTVINAPLDKLRILEGLWETMPDGDELKSRFYSNDEGSGNFRKIVIDIVGMSREELHKVKSLLERKVGNDEA